MDDDPPPDHRRSGFLAGREAGFEFDPPGVDGRSVDAVDQPTVEVGFLLIPAFPMMCLSSAFDALRHANRHIGYERYHYRTYALGGGVVKASNRLDIQTGSDLVETARPEALFVACGFNPEEACDPRTLGWLRLMARRGVRMGGLSAGSYILARAGLLEGRRATIHWEYAPAFRETFPDVELTDLLYVIDGDRCTCSGGAATTDLFLNMIASDLGPRTAAAAAEQMLIDRVRSAADRQVSAALYKAKATSAPLARAIEQMEIHIEEPLSLQELARYVQLTRRQLHRLFRQHTGDTPTEFYRALRLRHARSLLKQTPAKIIDVAMSAGFGSHSHFTKAYRDYFGVSPTHDRRGA